MLHVLACGLVFAAAPPAAPRPADAGVPTITALEQRDNGVFVTWTSGGDWDAYIVSYTMRGRPGSDQTPGGAQGSDLIFPLPVPGTEVDVWVQGAFLNQSGGIAVLSPRSVGATITVINLITVRPTATAPIRHDLLRPRKP